MLATKQVPNMTGKPFLFHTLGVIGNFVFSDSDATTFLKENLQENK